MTGKEGDYRKGMKVNKGAWKRRISIPGLLALLCLLTGMLSGCGFIEWLLEDEEDFYEEEQETEGEDGTEDSGSTVSLSERGTVISQENGKLVIDRRSRDQEIPMGEDGWTIFVYLCGSDLESDGGAASDDIEEALAAYPSQQTRVVYQTGGSSYWYQDISDERLERFVLENGELQKVDERPNANMGDAGTLSEFLIWGVQHYPAERMGVILWDHGSGSINGVCFDEQYEYDSLSIAEMAAAFDRVYDSMTDRFEFIGFDACLMSTLEVANQMVPYARYLYASEEYEPGTGWDYTGMLDYLAENPAADGKALGKQICEDYYVHCREADAQQMATFSVTELSGIDDLVQACNQAFQVVYEQDDLGDAARKILGADNFGGNTRVEGYTNMVDLGMMLDNLSDYGEEIERAREKLEECVVYNVNGRLHKQAGGLSVYYPISVQGSEELQTFAQLCPCNYYYALVDKVAYGAGTGSAQDYDNSSLLQDIADLAELFGISAAGISNPTTNIGEFASVDESELGIADIYFDCNGNYVVEFEDMDELAYACCSVFVNDGEDGIFYVGSTEEIYYDYENNLIRDDFDGLWLTADGVMLPLELAESTDTCSIYACEIMLNGEYDTALRIEYDWEYGEWSVIGIWDGIDPETGAASREVYELEDGDVFEPVYYWTSLDDDTEEWYLGDACTVDGEVELTYDYLPAGYYFYSFELHDIYGNVYYTPYITQEIDEEGNIWFYPEDMEDT